MTTASEPTTGVGQAALAVLERLRAVGWYRRGTVGPNGEVCVVVAICQSNLPELTSQALRDTIRQRIGCGAIGLWNDAAATTWEDVENLLLEIAAT